MRGFRLRDPDRGHFDPHGDVLDLPRVSSHDLCSTYAIFSSNVVQDGSERLSNDFPLPDEFSRELFVSFFLLQGRREEKGEATTTLEGKQFLRPGKLGRRSSRFCPPPPHFRPSLLLLSNESIRRFTCFHLEQLFSLPFGLLVFRFTDKTQPPLVNTGIIRSSIGTWPRLTPRN